jgi:excisionase family DNA binding protein
MSDTVRLLLAELLDVVERDEELRARLRALVADDGSRPSADGPLFFSVADVVERSGLSEKTVRRAIAEGELPASKVRHRLLVAADDLETWVRAGRGRRRRVSASRPSSPGAGRSFVATLRSRSGES